MVYNYNGVQISYSFHNGYSSRPILLLHGWGSDSKVFKDLISFFPEKSFLTIDFPPFGQSGQNISDWNIFTYVGMLMSLLDYLKIDKCEVLGHSFGGRVAIILCAVKCSCVQSCILVDSAGIKPKRSLKYYYRVLKYKRLKKRGKDISQFGSSDYRTLPENLKPLFNQIVNTYLNEYCKKISVKTMIVWGEKDTTTPLYMAKRLNKLIRNSRCEIISDAGHFSFIDKSFKFYKLAKEFWEEL